MRCTFLIALVIAAAWCLPTTATAQTTALFVDSQPGDPIGGGLQYLLEAPNYTFQVQRNLQNGVGVSVSTSWSMDFTATDNVPLQPGAYYGTLEDPWTKFNGMHIAHNFTPTDPTGRFVVREIEYGPTGDVLKLAIDFEQHMFDGGPGLFGAIRFHSTISSLVPFDGAYPSYVVRVSSNAHGVVSGEGLDCRGSGPVCEVSFSTPTTMTLDATPDPGYIFAGWSPPCNGTKSISLFVNTVKPCEALFTPLTPSSPQTLFWLNSQPEPYAFGGGTREVYSPFNSRWSFQVWGNAGVANTIVLDLDSVEAKREVDWTFYISAPGNQPLVPGTYPANGLLRVSWGSVGCLAVGGSFTVHELVVANRVVTKLAIDFQHQCGSGLTGSLFGSIRFNSLLAPNGSLAIDLSGQGSVALSPSGRVCSSDCAETQPAGTIVQLAPTPASPDWVFPGWSGDSDCVDGTLTLDAPTMCRTGFQGIPIAHSVTPNAGTGTTQTFTLRYSSSIGANDLATVRVRFGASNVGPGTCTASYGPFGLWSLLNDAGTEWKTPGALGSLSNSQCTLNLGYSSAVKSGNDVILTLNITFDASFAGSKNIYMLATSATGSSSGWGQRGTWTVGPDLVQVISLSPQYGSGAAQAFTLQYSDLAGAGDLSIARVRFGYTSGDAAGTCSAWYDANAATIRLMNDAGVWGSPVPLGSGTLSNSQCTLNLASSTATLSGNDLTLMLNITFAPAFAGPKDIFMLAGSKATTYAKTVWLRMGTWWVGPMLDATSIAPGSGMGTTQTFTALFYDSMGVTNDLRVARVRFGASTVGACAVDYNAMTNQVRLLDDAGAAPPFGPFSGTLANSQCTVDLGQSSATANGADLTLNLRITFKPALLGWQPIYLRANSNFGSVTTGWLWRGQWYAGTNVQASSVTPSNGSGSAQTFTLAYSDADGVTADLKAARVRFRGFGGLNGLCVVDYNAMIDQVRMQDDAGNWGAFTSFGAGTLSNSFCTLDLAQSSAAPSGTNLTLTLRLSFTPAFAGSRVIDMRANSNSGSTSNWIQRGNFTVTP